MNADLERRWSGVAEQDRRIQRLLQGPLAPHMRRRFLDERLALARQSLALAEEYLDQEQERSCADRESPEGLIDGSDARGVAIALDAVWRAKVQLRELEVRYGLSR